MVSGLRMEDGSQIMSSKVLNTIKSIKEIVGNHSDADIYDALKETDMDPNETTEKLLNQDPFHEVKRRRDRKKVHQSVGFKGSAHAAESRTRSENVGQGVKLSAPSDRHLRRRGYSQSFVSVTGIRRQFRVVRDNRVNQNLNNGVKPSVKEQFTSGTSDKCLPSLSGSQKQSSLQNSSHVNGPTDFQTRQRQDARMAGPDKKAFREEKQDIIQNTAVQAHSAKENNFNQSTASLAPNNSAVGLYSSSTDPVHVPSPDSRSSGPVGAIRREVGVVGVRRPSSENHGKQSPPSSNSFLGKDGRSDDSFQSLHASLKNEHLNQSSLNEPVVPSISVGRPFMSNQHSGRQHQQLAGHQRATHPSKEWKPKSSQRSSSNSPGVIGTPKKSISSENSGVLGSDAVKLQDKISHLNLNDEQNVIIAEHIRVSATDRYQLTFGTIGAELDSSKDLCKFLPVRSTEESGALPEASLSVSVPEPSGDEMSGVKQPDTTTEDLCRNRGSVSPVSGAASDQNISDNKESSGPHNMDNYADIGLVQANSPSYVPSESHQRQQDAHDLPGFSAYDAQSGCGIPYFRPKMDDNLRVQGLPSPQEALTSHTANGILPASTMALVQQQQQPPVAQMYPQVHVSHFGNLMPYRQFLSPVYVPPMAVPGYSSNPPYSHPPNGSSYLLMPGGGSHLNTGSVKFGVQQFKPIPAGNPTGFGSFTNPAGYAINAHGVVGGAAALEDSSRMKFTDGNLYVPNPQAETSEIWIQNPRDLPSMQSNPYYNMPGQTPPAAYMASHTGHASFNAAAAQSSHMQYPGMYHPPPQQAALASGHHLGPAIGNNVGVGVAAAPGAQVGGYQQPQMGHHWTTSF